MTKRPEPVALCMNRPHVVLLGAGASLAALPNGDRNGSHLPLMWDIVDVVGLGPLLDAAGATNDRDDFETLFSDLVTSGSAPDLVTQIEQRLFDYFASLRLPDEPTLYDHLVLSLRDKDVIATLNWDPFLWHAINRCHEYSKGNVGLPRLLFLHGNTAIGYTKNGEQVLFGQLGRQSRAAGRVFKKGPLLFPVAQKNYQVDELISRAWDDLRGELKAAYLFTIFGYSAPVTDVEAVELLQEGWGNRYDRNLEEIEIIDIRPESDLRSTWESFIHSHHYRTTESFYSSILANSPRRSCDALWGELIDRNPIHPTPLPWEAPWDELIAAARVLANAESSTSEVMPANQDER